ncbi:MAG: amidohydrolase family protein [Chloroflexota bacterium]
MEGERKIIDCHAHVWRYPDHFVKEELARVYGAKLAAFPEERLAKIFDSPVEAYLAETEGIVHQAILLGLQFPKTLAMHVPNDYLSDTVKKYPDRLAWCCAVDPTQPSAADEVERCVKLGAIGIGELGPAYSYFNVTDKRCFPVWEKAQESGLPVVIHAGASSARWARLSFANLANVDELAISFPELKIVVAHAGFYRFEDGMFLARKHPNVFCDISWLTGLAGLDRVMVSRHLPEAQNPYFNFVYPLAYYFSQTYGEADKLLFGSDWRASSPKLYVETLARLNDIMKSYNLPPIPQKSIDNILYHNWKRVFRL